MVAVSRRRAPSRRSTAGRAAPPSPDLDRVDGAASAREAGLRYSSDERPGIRRLRSGKGFRYVDADGAPVRDPDDLARIRALAIPPAYRDVWICPDGRGHLQATGRDAKGRKQYRYHPRWRTVRDGAKFERMVAFGEALPAIRRRVVADLARPGLPKEKVLAAVLQLLDSTHIRVGNDEYAQHNDSFGLTTMRDDHVAVSGATLRFAFRGKSGKEHTVDLHDRRLAAVVRRCRELPGQDLFQYIDGDDERRAIDSADVNDYLRAISGGDFTAKDFRTWAGTVLALTALCAGDPGGSTTAAKRAVVEAVAGVARRLGNTPAVCRASYIHPAVIDAFLESALPALALADAATPPSALTGLLPAERAVLTFLRTRPTPQPPARRGRRPVAHHAASA